MTPTSLMVHCSSCLCNEGMPLMKVIIFYRNNMIPCFKCDSSDYVTQYLQPAQLKVVVRSHYFHSTQT